MKTTKYKVLVLGAGINGLGSALKIQETCPGVEVTIMADKFSPETTSDGAAGFWEVFGCSDDDEQLTTELADVTFKYLKDLAMSPLAGVTGTFKISGCQMKSKPFEEELVLKNTVEGYRKMTPDELKQYPGAKDGRYFTSIIAEAATLMKWFTKRVLANGGCLVKRKINSLNELSTDWDVVVNCTGLGSYHLLQDKEMFPIRGQVFRVHAPWIKHFSVHDEREGDKSILSYVLPNQNEVVVGGTLQKDNWSTQFSEEDAKDIWARVVKFFPNLKHATIVKSWVGLRPGRSRLRLESEVMQIGQNKIRVVHNYGHGGAGISMFWGCAEHTANMVANLLHEIERDDKLHQRSKL